MAQQGTWNIFGWRPPDLGWTEALTGGRWGGSALNNPAYQSVPGVYQSPYQSPGSVLGANSAVNYSAPASYPGQTSAADIALSQGQQQTGGGGPQQQQQPQQQQRPGNAPPYDPSFNGQTVNYGGGQWKAINGQWAWEGSNEERAAADLRVRQEEESMINSIYAPAFSTLEEQKRTIEGQQPGEEAKIQGAYERGLEGVTGQEAEAQTQLGKRTTTSEQAKASALAQARQLYGELSQRYGAMFGSRTSAGPFATELFGRETTKRFGEIGAASEQDRQAIAEETTRLGRWVDTQKNEWERKKNEAVTELKKVFNQNLAQINAQRGVLEAQKAKDRYTALIDAKNRQAAIEAADRDFQQKLSLFQAQKQSELASVSPYEMGGYSSETQGLAPYAAPTMSQTGGQTTTPSFAPGQEAYTWRIDPITGKRIITGYR